MLSEYPIHTALPAMDLQRAKRFYADKLGLTPKAKDQMASSIAAVGERGFSSFPPEAVPAEPIPR